MVEGAPLATLPPRHRAPAPSRTAGIAAETWRRTARAAFALAVLGLALSRAAASYAATIPRGGDPWMTGDWLVNYAGGFVRRGLFGHIFVTVAPGGEAGLWALFVVQLACYAAVLAYGLRVLHLTAYSWSSIALVCGPAALAFIGWDLSGGFRKEILAIAALALLGWSRRPARSRAAVIALVTLALALWGLAVFSWEPAALLLPAVVYLLWVEPDAPLHVVRRSAAALFGAVALLGGLASVLAHGDVAAATAICDRVREAGFVGTGLCSSPAAGGGAIEAIGWTAKEARTNLAALFPLYLGYVPLIAFALAPLLVSRWFASNRAWALAIGLGVLPLYAIAADYGRWTHVLVLVLMVCMTAQDPAAAESVHWKPLAATLYVVLWGMPNHLSPEAWWEWFGLVVTLVYALMEALSILLGFPVTPGITRVVM